MAHSRTVLIQCGDHFENQTRIELLSSTLLAMGHRPVVMLYARGKGDIFRRTGASVVYLNDYLHQARRHRPGAINDPVAMNVSVARLIEIEARRRPMIGWPGQIGKTVADGARYLVAIDRMLADIKPDRVAIWNGFTGYAANALRLLCEARHIRAAYLERGLRRDSLFIDALGVNGASSLGLFDPESLPEPDETVRAHLAQWFPERRTNQSTTDDPDARRRILFPMQVELDTNILLYSPYSSMRRAFLAIHELLATPHTEFIVRPHPEEVPGHRSNIPAFDRVCVTNEGSLTDWIDSCDLVATINSTVGLEALLRGKPVLALGASIYSAICPTPGPDRVPGDYRVSATRLDKFLHELGSSNLLIDGSECNPGAAARQLNLVQLASGQWARPVTALSQIETVAHHLEANGSIVVDVAMDPARPLNLTYRNARQRLDMGLLKTQLFPGVQANRITLQPAGQSDRPAQVLVVDEGWRGRSGTYLAVANNYGIVLAAKGQ